MDDDNDLRRREEVGNVFAAHANGMSGYAGVNTFLGCIRTALCITLCIHCCAATTPRPTMNYVIVKDESEVAPADALATVATNGAALPLLSVPPIQANLDRS